MSQESSLHALNSLFQLIDSRVSTFKAAIQLSSCLDILYTGIIEEEVDEIQTLPAIFEDKDESEEESEDAMETDQGSGDEKSSANSDSDTEESHGLISD
ncbi:WD repeat-containing protein 43 [Quillaja saponaria]|uniref:WD repeat-containing protein 43 n=1 Tax=Quillaja saponaria TaxID=32244 RepID=A0AAD7PDT1_QUISA|nr:WD repeat-containing protein 43 [Quillaja saponaria]